MLCDGTNSYCGRLFHLSSYIHSVDYEFSRFLFLQIFRLYHKNIYIYNFFYLVVSTFINSSGCVSGVMNSGSECEIRETSSNSSQICYIHLCANTFERGMNPSPPPSYGLNDKTFIWNLQKIVCTIFICKKRIILTTQNMFQL